MKALTTILFLCVVVMLSSCTKTDLKVPYEFIGVPKDDIESLLIREKIETIDRDLILSDLSPVYSYVTVKRYHENGNTYLIIDQFNYDEWTNSGTGEVGKAPHGRKSILIYTRDGWEGTTSVYYGG